MREIIILLIGVLVGTAVTGSAMLAIIESEYKKVIKKEGKNMDTTFDIKAWCHAERKAIDACITEVKNVIQARPENGGAEITLAYRSLQVAKMWLGKALEENGNELPAEFRDKAE